MIYIHFIINPISGNGKHNLTASLLRNFFPRSEFTIAVDYTKYKQHAIALTKYAANKGPDIIVACGGDGTINEVASSLVGTSIKLGIVPVGSGNGLASNLNIPKNLDKALKIIRKGHSNPIDVGQINDKYFFSNMGIGVDAMIIKKYEQSGKRTLSAYVKAALASGFNFKSTNTKMVFNDKVLNVNPFMLFVSNSNEMGYNMTLTPKASLSDGWLDLVVVTEISTIDKLKLGYAVLRNKIEYFNKAQHDLIQNLKIEMPDKIFTDAQIDGEHHNLKTNIIEVSIIQKGLNVVMEQ
ncbi:hypothetical protein FNO01nite_14720 [Flavobacterium noncentrifugens]|uniref:Lipid kinase, YegS/Rv2252/BmrU family n=1 Tax=Flavobacterium noncentrifugens TaxID=1128970 RepID=A0A1G8W752_9FLAO|nr:diacylglycerol kinase family protein [Flavobacterium noncentrifugens]GEP50800.1 hypothetical protein FNO01nite_14720 [Flavobacterium noncentrifugens]SDJ74108.1 lipid kinase, YegS/Rv2252/BmrU family [Flavobacterium noncentrifugens]